LSTNTGGYLHNVTGAATTAGRSARSAAREVVNNTWGERAVRAGIAARGIVFLFLGYLLARIAMGALGGTGTGRSASGPGVAKAIAAQTGGRAVLVLLAVGLALYALFGLVELFRSPETERSEVKRWLDRARLVWQCLLYLAFAGYCVLTALSRTSGSGSASRSDRQQQQWSARVLRWPAGWLWLVLLGLILFALAGYQVWRCTALRFRDDLKTGEMSPLASRLTTVTGVVGQLGRGGTFALVGWFVMAAAIEDDPQKGRGVDGSARTLAATDGGAYLLWVLAVGLVVFAVYQFLESRYRKI
jgi:hypothetical protein